MSQAAGDSLFKQRVVIEEDRSVRHNEDGSEVTKRVTKFPFRWIKAHFDRSTNSYITKPRKLDSED